MLMFREVSSESDFDDDANGNLGAISLHMKGHNIHSVDVTSEAFLALPTEIQHEILLELRDTRKQSSWNSIHQMPQVILVACFLLLIPFLGGS
jgi:hypothetical protein